MTSLADGSVLARLVVEDEQDQWLAIRPQEDGTLDVYSGIQSADDDALVVWNKGENYSVQDYFGGNMYMDLVGLFPLIDAVPFDDLTYDVIRNAYLGTINVDGDLVSVEFMFEDDLLQSAEFRLGEITVDVLFNYGDATIDSWYGLGRVILDDDAIASIVSDLADCLNVTAKVDINDKENEKRIAYDVFKIDGSESEGFLRAQTDDVYYQYMDEMLYRIRYSTVSERWIGELTEEGESLGVCDILGRLLSAADGFTYDKQYDIYRYGHSGGEGFIRIEDGVIVEYYFRSSALDIDAELWDYGKTQVELPQYDILYSQSDVLAICDKIPTSETLNQYNYQNDALKSVTTFYFDDFSLNSDHTDVLSAKVKAYIEDNEAYFIVEGGKQLILNKVNGSWVAEDSNFPLYSIVEYKDIRQAITDYELIRFGSFRKQNDNTFYCFFEGNGPVSITIGILHGYVSLFELYNTEDGTLQRCEYSDINDTDLQLPEYTVK